MKKILIFLSIQRFFMLGGDIPLFNNPELGKTHFIIGFPEAKSERPVAPMPQGNLHERLIDQDGKCIHAFFSPDDDLASLMIELIYAEQKSIALALFSFTDGTIAQALMNAYDRGIKITLVVDGSAVRDKFSKINLLKKHGITVFVYEPHEITILNNIMHNKFVLFEKNVGGKSLLWTGSYNFTKSASKNNQENILLLDTMKLIERYRQQFLTLKQRSLEKTLRK